MTDPIYMERRAFEFFRAFPDVPDVLRPVYSRFYDAGLLWLDPNVDSDGEWPGQLRWTAAGRDLRDHYDENFPSGAVNVFSLGIIRRLFPSGDLGDVERRIFKDEIPGQIPPTGHPRSPIPAGLLAAMSRLEIACSDLITTWRTHR